MSGDLQGAGGVGGLLCVTQHQEPSTQHPYYPSYDANGNISEYVDASDSVVAHYEYSPFGKLTSSSGSKSGDFRHRFSTKYHDSETALYYYGYRYYSTELGRWINRDPVREDSGLNIYAFVMNNGIGLYDLLGLSSGEAFPNCNENSLGDIYTRIRREEIRTETKWQNSLKDPNNAGKRRIGGVANFVLKKIDRTGIGDAVSMVSGTSARYYLQEWKRIIYQKIRRQYKCSKKCTNANTLYEQRGTAVFKTWTYYWKLLDTEKLGKEEDGEWEHTGEERVMNLKEIRSQVRKDMF